MVGGPALVQDFFTQSLSLQSCLCHRHPSSPSSFLLSMQGETLVSPRYSQRSDTLQGSWCPLTLSLAVSHAFIPVPGSWSCPSSFFLRLCLKELCQRCFCANEALPCHSCTPEYWNDTLKWNYLICFLSKHRLFILPSTSPMVFRININNKIIQLNLKHKCVPDLQQIISRIMMVMRVVDVNMCYSA